MKQKVNYREILLLLATIPIVVNFLLTFNEEIKYQILKFFISSLPLTIFLFLFFYVTGVMIKEAFNLKTITFSISLVFSSLFILDNIFLFLSGNFKFRYVVYFYLIFLYFLIFNRVNNSKKYFYILFLVVLFSFMNILSGNGLFFDKHLELFTSDEERLWIPTTQLIYEQNYLVALQSSNIEGYGLYSSYIKSFISTITTISDSFVYNASISNLFLLFFFLTIYEINSKKRIKLILTILFFSIFFTNNWLNYLFFNSLLGEGPAGFIFGATVIELTKYEKKVPSFLLVYLAFNIYGKNFLTVVTIFVLFIYLFRYKKVSYFVAGMVPVLISLINSILFKIGYLWEFYFSESNSQKSQQNWSPVNLGEILKEFYIDKTLSIVFVLIFVFYIFSKDKLKKFGELENLSETVFFVNIFIVIAVYLFLVNEYTAIQDSYRYLINTLFLIPNVLTKYTHNNQ